MARTAASARTAPTRARTPDHASEQRAHDSGRALPGPWVRGLDAVAAAYAPVLARGLAQATGRDANVVPRPTRTSDAAAWSDAHPSAAHTETFVLPPLPGCGSIRVDSGLAEAAVEALFGGAGRARSRAAEAAITPVGHRVAGRLIAIALRALPAAWRNVHPVDEARPDAHARNPEAPSGHTRGALAIVELSVEIGPGRGVLLLALPRDMLEPAGVSLAAVPPDDAATRGHARLLAHLARAEVEITVEIPLRLPEAPHAPALRTGDVIALDPAAPALARVNGVPLAQCRYGTLHGHNAVAVERMLRPGTNRPAREDASEA